MTAMPVAQQMAADDYLTQPYNGRRTQLVEGEVVMNEPKWLVDTAADEVLVFRRSRTGAPSFDVSLELTREDTLTSPLLPGFELPLSSLF